ncbi:MAG TPA: biotin/lipoyl-containing protein [Candidatus Limnocylindrales bacterium]|nr:biotin/lipoyl-containing protein [Candidatus Limnocylindrales bacterium]
MAAVSIRATLRGAQEGTVEPRVVERDAAGGSVELHGGARATLREAGSATPRQVLIQPLDRPGPAAARRLEVVVDGWRFEIEVEPEQRAALRERARRDRGDASHSGPLEVRAIIPGVVLSVAVAPGDEVAAGQQLLVVEAMKMQNELRASRAGTVERVTVGERSTIEVGDVLVVIE